MKKRKKINKKKGILFWITGLSGSGKTLLAKKIKKDIKYLYGPTLVISGDDVRNIFSLKGYTYRERLHTVKKYCKLVKFLTSQKINVIFAVIGMMDQIRKWNKKNIDNYIEIYVKSQIEKIIKQKRKKIYFSPKKNIVGLDIKPEFPKNPDIIITNNFKNDLNELSKILIKKINNLID
tara:strand:+ start:1084 stop:1617 length:534 start_codon:yes stop_codon:yes gene_type:complete